MSEKIRSFNPRIYQEIARAERRVVCYVSRKMRSFRTLLWIGLAAALPASAQFYVISTPTAQYTGNTTVLPIVAANFASVASLTAGGQTVTFTPSLTAASIGTGWNFWGAPPNTESSTPRLLETDPGVTTVTLALSAPATTFGFELDPANVAGSPFSMTATFLNGATTVGTITRTIAFNGALLMAGSSATPITSVVITAPGAAGGFAIAQLRFGNVLLAPVSTVPALGTAGLGTLGLLLAAAGSLLARRRQII
jgi:hypothetical protein